MSSFGFIYPKSVHMPIVADAYRTWHRMTVSLYEDAILEPVDPRRRIMKQLRLFIRRIMRRETFERIP